MWERVKGDNSRMHQWIQLKMYITYTARKLGFNLEVNFLKFRNLLAVQVNFGI